MAKKKTMSRKENGKGLAKKFQRAAVCEEKTVLWGAVWPDWVPEITRRSIMEKHGSAAAWMCDAAENGAPSLGETVAVDLLNFMCPLGGPLEHSRGSYVHLGGLEGVIVDREGVRFMCYVDAKEPVDDVDGVDGVDAAKKFAKRGLAAQAEIDRAGMGKEKRAGNGAPPLPELKPGTEALRLEMIEPGEIEFSADNTRENIEGRPDWAEFAENVRINGVRVPVHVRLNAGGGKPYVLVAGERRVRAALAGKLLAVPAVVHETMSEGDAIELTILENYGREDLSPIEQSRGVTKMLERRNGDVRAVAALFGRSERWVRLRAKLQDLSAEWQKDLVENHRFASWSIGHLELIARLPADAQGDALKHFALDYCTDRMDVEELDRWIGKTLLMRLVQAPWNVANVDVAPNTGACRQCEQRSSQQGVLFHDADESEEEVRKGDRCLNPKCWARKLRAWQMKRLQELRQEHGEGLVFIAGDYDGKEKPIPVGKAKVHASYNVQPAKKTDKGAVPALVVSGRGTGGLQWIKPPTPSSSDIDNERERRIEETRRHWNDVCREVCRRIEKVELADAPTHLSTLTVAVLKGNYYDFFRELAKAEKLTDEELEGETWMAIREKIARASDGGYGRERATAVTACKLFGWDAKKIYNELKKQEEKPAKGEKGKPAEENRDEEDAEDEEGGGEDDE